MKTAIRCLLMVGAAVFVSAAFARPGFGPHHGHYVHHPSGWGRGGCNFWPGFVGGVVGGVIGSAISRPVVVSTPAVVAPAVVTPAVVTPTVVTTPAVVTTPVVAQPVVTQTVVAQPTSVWVEGRYIDQVQPNGAVLRVWQPGHYEQTSVIVQ